MDSPRQEKEPSGTDIHDDALVDEDLFDDDLVEGDLLVEDVSIDGMCGVY